MSVSPARSSSVITMVSVTTVLSFGVYSRRSMAALISDKVPWKVMVTSSVPSPTEKLRPASAVGSRERTPLVTDRVNSRSEAPASLSLMLKIALTRSLAPSVLVNPPNPLPSKMMSRPGSPTPRLLTVPSVSGSGPISGGELTNTTVI